MNGNQHYLSLLAQVLAAGQVIETRNSRCKRLFGMRVKLTSFPLVWTRRTAWKTCLRELEWFMSGSNHVSDLHPSARAWWEPWEAPSGTVHYNYAAQLRCSFGTRERTGFDQVDFLTNGIARHPFSRRNVITTWNTADMAESDCAITNCWGTVLQAFVDTGNTLHLVTYQRSADVVCGLSHNWVQIWALLLYFAHRGGRKPGTVTWLGGDVHVYEAHESLASRMLALPEVEKSVDLVYTPTSADFTADDFTLSGPYSPLLEDRAEMIV